MPRSARRSTFDAFACQTTKQQLTEHSNYRTKPLTIDQARVLTLSSHDMLVIIMNPKPLLFLLITICLTGFATLSAHSATEPEISEAEFQARVNAKLHFQTGEVMLPGEIAKLSLSDGFRYLPPADADFVLTKLWGNPPGQQTLGMIFPSDMGPASSNTWGVIITFSDDGYVKDSDADSINYDKLLKQMQKGATEANKERAKQGFGTVELIGWATRPHYDKDTRKMYWAKELKFSDSDGNTLNYNIRVLGRRGVLNLNVVAGMDALQEIQTSAPAIVGLVNFTEGNRYADYKEGTDKVAAYGLAALVAGGFAAKAGFFKVLIAGLLAAKKFVIIGLIALFAIVKKFFLGKPRTEA